MANSEMAPRSSRRRGPPGRHVLDDLQLLAAERVIAEDAVQDLRRVVQQGLGDGGNHPATLRVMSVTGACYSPARWRSGNGGRRRSSTFRSGGAPASSES